MDWYLCTTIGPRPELAELHGKSRSRMTARAYGAVHNPEHGPEVRRVLAQLLQVLDDTSQDGMI